MIFVKVLGSGDWLEKEALASAVRGVLQSLLPPLFCWTPAKCKIFSVVVKFWPVSLICYQLEDSAFAHPVPVPSSLGPLPLFSRIPLPASLPLLTISSIFLSVRGCLEVFTNLLGPHKSTRMTRDSRQCYLCPHHTNIQVTLLLRAQKCAFFSLVHSHVFHQRFWSNCFSERDWQEETESARSNWKVRSQQRLNVTVSSSSMLRFKCNSEELTFETA